MLPKINFVACVKQHTLQEINKHAADKLEEKAALMFICTASPPWSFPAFL